MWGLNQQSAGAEVPFVLNWVSCPPLLSAHIMWRVRQMVSSRLAQFSDAFWKKPLGFTGRPDWRPNGTDAPAKYRSDAPSQSSQNKETVPSSGCELHLQVTVPIRSTPSDLPNETRTSELSEIRSLLIGSAWKDSQKHSWTERQKNIGAKST